MLSTDKPQSVPWT